MVGVGLLTETNNKNLARQNVFTLIFPSQLFFFSTVTFPALLFPNPHFYSGLLFFGCSYFSFHPFFPSSCLLPVPFSLKSPPLSLSSPTHFPPLLLSPPTPLHTANPCPLPSTSKRGSGGIAPGKFWKKQMFIREF